MNQPLKITICDDSRLAQRQLSLAIRSWNAQITIVDNGEKALESIRSGRAELLFLDLNMPILDGYQVLQRIREQGLPTMVIVVSGDIQEKALKKVTALGALDFISKPISTETLHKVIDKLGLLQQLTKLSTEQSAANDPAISILLTQQERLQETANIAMGRAAERLSILLDTFISLSIPEVNFITNADLYMIINGTGDAGFTATISQGFVGEGISGESILIIDKSGLPHISQLLGFPSEINADLEQDILVDLAGLLSSSFLKTYFQQIGIPQINQGVPSFLDSERELEHLIKSNGMPDILTITVTYSIPSHNIFCDLLLIFTLESIEPMNQRSELFSWSL